MQIFWSYVSGTKNPGRVGFDQHFSTVQIKASISSPVGSIKTLGIIMSRSLASTLGYTLILSGCTSAVWVSSDGQGVKDAKGIPFYVKKEFHEETLVCTQTWFDATLKIDKIEINPDNPKDRKTAFSFSETKQLTKKEINNELMEVKRKLFDLDKPEGEKIKGIINLFLGIQEINDTNSVPITQKSRSVKSVWKVDGATKYYLNAPLPWFGSTSLTQEISSDGTLSKATSAPNTQLSEGVAALIPFKEYFSARYVDPIKPKVSDTDPATPKILGDGNKFTKKGVKPAPTIKPRPPETEYAASIEIVEAGYVYTASMTRELKRETGDEEPFSCLSRDHNFSMETIEKVAERAVKKDEDPSIGIIGKITLPQKKDEERQ